MLDHFQVFSGTPQSRISTSDSSEAVFYPIYGQSQLNADLAGEERTESDPAESGVKTFDSVRTFHPGDIAFSLIAPKAALVSTGRNGYMQTSNFVRLIPSPGLDAGYLVYLLNEDPWVRSQLENRQTSVMASKTTIKQIQNLQLPELPPLKIQKGIGRAYQIQKRIASLSVRLSQLKEIYLSLQLRRIAYDQPRNAGS